NSVYKNLSGRKSIQNIRITGCGLWHMSNFRSIVEKIKALENERQNLLLEIEELKKMADAKVRALESEVSMLREEVRSLRMLLGTEEAESESRQKKKK
ncbi:MAG: hypothetical protein ACUVUE_07210, partial [Candidatus Bathycorpusculaceae bacterium]